MDIERRLDLMNIRVKLVEEAIDALKGPHQVIWRSVEVQRLISALETARHELTWLHGLKAFDTPEFNPEQVIHIDTLKALKEIDAALDAAEKQCANGVIEK